MSTEENALALLTVRAPLVLGMAAGAASIAVALVLKEGKSWPTAILFGAGAFVGDRDLRERGDLVGPLGWNRDLLSAELEFDREEYLFTVECARDAWTA
ncbi:hypothetical protein ACFXJ8_07250 [Nonomuraea sp. NPDC059194]|uniref:hypothetical protein n=1 Tax=Nonomuraea sp. NPDC059194 TaxID=3346764 RepID=UPI0036BB04AD